MFNDFLWTYILIAVLIALGIYFTVKTNFVQFKNIKEMFKLLSEGSSSSEKGSISSFQAFCIGTASRVGTGNLAGVATAIAVGGPGAVFWMWLTGLFGMATKFGEGIRVNAIAPGFFLTEQNRALLTNEDGSYTERGNDVIRQTPFKRFGRAEELCGTIQYLISEASSFVTGTVAVVDGGFNIFAM